MYDTPPPYGEKTDVRTNEVAIAAARGYYGPLGPAQLQQAYRVPSGTAGSGQVVGIVDAYDDPTAEADLGHYRRAFNLSPCTSANGCFRKLNESGAASPLPVADPEWATEISLDLDMVSAICPRCRIVLVEANSNLNEDLGASVLAAHAAGATQISNSYGSPECELLESGTRFCLPPFRYAHFYNIAKTVITAASGDEGWFAGPQTPADYGTVVAVGGTSLFPFRNIRGWIETAWEDGGSSCDRYLPAPSWIPADVSRTCAGKRPSVDIAAVADPITGVLTYQTYPAAKGHYFIVGGTSVASPIIASIYALAGNATSQDYGARLYRRPDGTLTDVVIGKNGVPGLQNIAGQVCVPATICVAAPGWDGPTGNGTPLGIGAF